MNGRVKNLNGKIEGDVSSSTFGLRLVLILTSETSGIGAKSGISGKSEETPSEKNLGRGG